MNAVTHIATVTAHGAVLMVAWRLWRQEWTAHRERGRRADG